MTPSGKVEYCYQKLEAECGFRNLMGVKDVRAAAVHAADRQAGRPRSQRPVIWNTERIPPLLHK